MTSLVFAFLVVCALCSLHALKYLHHAHILSMSFPLSLVHPFRVTVTGTGFPAAGNSGWFHLNLGKQDGNQMQLK